MRILFLLVLFCTLTFGQRVAYHGQGSPIECRGFARFSPETYPEVGFMVQQASALGKRVKVVGSLQANNDISCGDGFIVSLSKLNRLVSLDSAKSEASFEAGILLGDLLQELQKRGYSLAQFPDYAGLSLGGILATGSFGSSLAAPSSLHDYVSSVTLANGKGELMVLKGNDLKAVLVNLGSLGIIVEATLKIVPLYKVRAAMEVIPEESLISTSILEQIKGFHRAEIFWFPESNTTLLRTYEQIGVEEEGKCANTELQREPDAWKEISTYFEQVQENGDTEAYCAASQKEAEELAQTLPFSDPEGPCYFPAGFPGDMLLTSCRQGSCPWESGLDLQRFAVAVPLRDLKEALTAVQAMVSAHKACFPFGGLRIRFVKESEAYLSLSHGGDRAVIELESLRRDDPQKPRLGLAALQEIEQTLKLKFGGRSHWGKAGPAMFFDAASSYPYSWGPFGEAKARFDPDGIFTNPFIERLTTAPQQGETKFCALENSCICTTTFQCSLGMNCSPGLITPAAKICLHGLPVEEDSTSNSKPGKKPGKKP